MKKAWLFLADRFDACKPRERLGIFLATAAVMVAFFVFLAFDPAFSRYQAAQTRMQQDGIDIQAAHAEQLALLVASGQDPDAALRAQIAQLDAANTAARQRLLKADAQLVDARKMTDVLRDLMARRPGLEMVSVQTLPVEDLFGEPKKDDVRATLPDVNGVPMGLYRHSLEVTVRGDYAALVGYLKAVEALPWKVRLSGIDIQTQTYPVSTMKITVYTLSMERAWLSM